MENKYNRNVKFKEIDYSKVTTHRQLFGSTGFNWQDLGITNMSNPTNLNLPSQRFQPADGTPCVEHGGATAIEKKIGKIVSAKPPYEGVGTIGQGTDINDYISWIGSSGTCLESISPSNNIEDADLKAPPMPSDLYFKALSPVFINPADTDVMDQIAETISAGNGVLILLGSNETEYDQENCTPKYIPGTEIEFHHEICGCEAGLIESVENIVNRDPAGQWSSPNGIRYLTQDFIQAPGHCTAIVYFQEIVDSTPAVIIPPTLPVSIPISKESPEWMAWFNHYLVEFTGKTWDQINSK